MPRIAAPTLREHRDRMRDRLIDAAESLLRDPGRPALTASAVAERAGIARNSIYRYVDSVDALAELVIQRHAPRWIADVRAAMAAAPTPAAQVLAYGGAVLAVVAQPDHEWLMTLADRGLSVGTRIRLAAIHTELAALLIEPVRTLDRHTPELTIAAVSALVTTLARSLTAHPHPEQVRDYALDAVAALVALADTAAQPPPGVR